MDLLYIYNTSIFKKTDTILKILAHNEFTVPVACGHHHRIHTKFEPEIIEALH
jgi:hypothetical protein